MAVKAIVKNASDITLQPAKKTGKEKFCDTWPTAKAALGLLQGTVKNPIAKAAIGIVIDAGDAVAKRIC
jgi:hypothetical protein